MTTIVYSETPSQHQGLNRVTAGFGYIARRAHDSRIVFAGLIAAAVVVANAVIQPTGLGAWLALWAVAFAATMVLAPAAKRTGPGIVQRWLDRERDARANEQMWQMAMADHRVMADLMRAQSSAGR